LITRRKEFAGPALLCAALVLAAIFFRPALPIDETRYLTAAWEMFLNHNYFLPTLNFEPYHHKPPLLFWLINLSWEIFGVHRWAAVLIVSLMSAGGIFLSHRLTRILFPGEEALSQRVPWIMVASFPFLVMGTAIMFDFTLSFCAMLAWVCAAKFMKTGHWLFVIPAGLALGFGVLAKGPVVVLFTLLPWLFAPLWFKDLPPKKKYYLGLLAMVIVGLGPVAVWLVQVFLGTSAEFFEWLVLKQTTGRITGSFGGAHSRPIYFYAPYFVALFLLWAFLPAFLRKLKNIDRNDDVLRFCFFTIVPALVVFTLMSGKQSHYLVPMTPFVVIFIAKILEGVSLPAIKKFSAGIVALMVIGQGVAAVTMFPRYDLSEVAKIVAAYPDRDWAYVRNYHGEVGFLARRTKPVEGLHDIALLPQWFGEHPGGLAVVRTRDEAEIKPYKLLYTMDYSRDKKLSVIELMPETSAP